MIREKLEALFRAYRFDPKHHLGLGDIRLTLGDQESILDDWQEPGLPWVSVEDGLPADGFTVLAVPASGGDPIDDFRDDGKWAFAEGEGETVTHWITLSALPLPGDEAKPAPEPEGLREVAQEALRQLTHRGPAELPERVFIAAGILEVALARPAAAEGAGGDSHE